jgi:hypothetical protein
MKTIAAVTLFGVLALASAGASGARNGGKPPFGVPDPALLVLRSSDVGGVRATNQGYYTDQGFASSYAREFHAARVGSTQLTWLESDVEVATVWSDARDDVAAFREVALRSSGQAALKKDFAGIDRRGISISHVTVLQPKPLTGTNGWDVEVHFKLNGLPAQGHMALFSVDRFLGILTAVGVGGHTLDRAAIARLGRTLTPRFRAVQPPVNLTRPTISGTPAVGQELTASPGTWANGPVRYRFQWDRCRQGSCTGIPGASSPTYVPTADDANLSLRVRVYAMSANGSDVAASELTAQLPGAPLPANVTPPVISGPAQVGQMLIATTGTWSGTPTTYAYAWRRCDDSLAFCTIVGANLSTYTPTSADGGSRIEVAVTASNGAGPAGARHRSGRRSLARLA